MFIWALKKFCPIKFCPLKLTCKVIALKTVCRTWNELVFTCASFLTADINLYFTKKRIIYTKDYPIIPLWGLASALKHPSFLLWETSVIWYTHTVGGNAQHTQVMVSIITIQTSACLNKLQKMTKKSLKYVSWL